MKSWRDLVISWFSLLAALVSLAAFLAAAHYPITKGKSIRLLSLKLVFFVHEARHIQWANSDVQSLSESAPAEVPIN